MANKILIKRSAVPAKPPATTDLALGEFGINTYDGKVYIKKNDGADSIVCLATGTGTSTGTNTGDNAANSSTHYIGTTAIALNRASAAQALTGITSIDGNAATVTNGVTTTTLNNGTLPASFTTLAASGGDATFTGPYTSLVTSRAISGLGAFYAKASSNVYNSYMFFGDTTERARIMVDGASNITIASITDSLYTRLYISAAGDITIPGSLALTKDMSATSGGALAIEALYAPTPVSAWVNFGGALLPLAYWKDAFGVVHLQGTIKSGTIGGSAIFTLPVGYRPLNECYFPVVSNNVYGMAYINSSGSVFAQVGSNVSFSFDGILFRTT